jgi:hypothetical protein
MATKINFTDGNEEESAVEVQSGAQQPDASASAKTRGERPPSVLDELKAVISKKIERPYVFIEVPERPGVNVRVSPNITQHQIRQWRKNCGEDSKNGVDPTKFACTVISATTTGIFVNNVEAFDEDGYSLNFTSPDIHKMTQTTRAVPDAVRAFFGIDPHVEAAALAVLEAAGYSDTVDTTDPTKTS